MGDRINLLAGTPDFFIAPQGEAYPDFDDIDPPGVVAPAPSGNWNQVGFTIEDFVHEYTREGEAVNVNEHSGDIKDFRVGEGTIVSFTLAENDLEAFSSAINGSSVTPVTAAADQTGQDTMGAGDGVEVEHSILFYAQSPEGAAAGAGKGSRIMQGWIAKQTGDTASTYSKAHAGIPISFKLLVDPTQTEGKRFFKYTDITAAATT